VLIKPSGGSLLNLVKRHPVEGVLVFRRSPAWWGWMFGDYGHVHAVVKSGSQWVAYMPSLDVTDITIVDNWRMAVPEGAEVIRFNVLRKMGRYRVPQLIVAFTCVEQIKALLGIANPFIVTPKQLYRRLNNGRIFQQAKEAKA